MGGDCRGGGNDFARVLGRDAPSASLGNGTGAVADSASAGAVTATGSPPRGVHGMFHGGLEGLRRSAHRAIGWVGSGGDVMIAVNAVIVRLR